MDSIIHHQLNTMINLHRHDMLPESILHECQVWQLSAFLRDEAAGDSPSRALTGDVRLLHVLDVEIGCGKGDGYCV